VLRLILPPHLVNFDHTLADGPQIDHPHLVALFQEQQGIKARERC
jgi:hypothetical protein